jgi:hypothetical protein
VESGRVRKPCSRMSNGPMVVSNGRRRDRSEMSSCACSMASFCTANISGRFFCSGAGGASGSEEGFSSSRSWKLRRPCRSNATRAWKRTRWISSSETSRRTMRHAPRFTYSRSQDERAAVLRLHQQAVDGDREGVRVGPHPGDGGLPVQRRGEPLLQLPPDDERQDQEAEHRVEHQQRCEDDQQTPSSPDALDHLLPPVRARGGRRGRGGHRWLERGRGGPLARAEAERAALVPGCSFRGCPWPPPSSSLVEPTPERGAKSNANGLTRVIVQSAGEGAPGSVAFR